MNTERRPLRRAGALASLLMTLAAVSLVGVAWHIRPLPAGRELLELPYQRTQALFDWGRFSAQQDTLMHQADDLSMQLGSHSVSGVQEKGQAIKQVLVNLMRGLHPKRSQRPQHKYVPMDQELAILKVQKQMRTEHKFGSDRIEGSGDVAAVVNEQGQADERNALMEDPDMGPDTKTKNLFENCEDGSLTAEDADLCGRRASAIKMITRAAIQQQLAKNPPVSPHDVDDEIDAEQENKARKKLVAYAMIGKQYVALLDEEKKADAQTQEERKALLAEGRSAHASKSQTLAEKLVHPRAELRAQSAVSPVQSTRGWGEAVKRSTNGRSHVKVKVKQARPQAQTPAPEPRKAAPTTSRNAADETAHRSRKNKKMAPSVGDLGPLQDLANAMPKHLDTPKMESKTRLRDLESAITDTQERLAKEKMRFTKEMLKRQKELQGEFLESMQQIHAGLSVVDDVGVPGEEADTPPSSKNMLAAEQAAFMQRQRDGVIAAAAAAAGPTLVATKQQNPVLAEVQREIAASHLFRHPPAPGQTSAVHRSAEDKEKSTIQAALEQQFDQVASDGSVAPKVRHDKWTDLMSQMSQALALQKPAAVLPADPAAHGVAQGKVSNRNVPSSALLMGSGAGTAGTSGGRASSTASRKARRKEGLRLLSSYEFKQGLHTGHIGPASYDALAAAAAADMKAAVSRGAPTLLAATKDALKADELAHNPRAELHDAERVLCSVAMLKKGLCSTGVAAKSASPAATVSAARMRRRVLTGVHSTRRRAGKKLAVSHLARDIESNVVGMFSPDGAGAAR